MMSAKKLAPQAAPGRRERRRLETREKIFRAAMQLFAERGFSQTTTEDITEAADVGQGTFFNYFPTKQHVLTVLSEKQMEKVSAAWQEAEEGNGPIREVLRRLMHRVAEEPGRTQEMARSLMTAFISADEVRSVVRDNMGRGREKVAAIIVLGQKRGEIRVNREPLALAMAFQRNVLGTLLLWAMHPRQDLHAWLEETFIDFWAAAEAAGNHSSQKRRRSRNAKTAGKRKEIYESA
jgi:AcrR family transcriptional regulator